MTAYARLARLVRRAEGAARWARFAREQERAFRLEYFTASGSDASADWRERAERIEARAAHLRALASEAGNLGGRA